MKPSTPEYRDAWDRVFGKPETAVRHVKIGDDCPVCVDEKRVVSRVVHREIDGLSVGFACRHVEQPGDCHWASPMAPPHRMHTASVD